MITSTISHDEPTEVKRAKLMTEPTVISPERTSSVSPALSSNNGLSSGGLSSGGLSSGGLSKTRPIRSCTHCRQQKIKCNASETYPEPCSKCKKMDRECRVDPFFKPQKGGQVQSLREDLSTLKHQVEYLQKRESLLASAVAKANPNSSLISNGDKRYSSPSAIDISTPSEKSILKGNRANDSVLRTTIASLTSTPTSTSRSPLTQPTAPSPVNEFVVGNVVLSAERAEQLHKRFMDTFLLYLPMMQSNSALELYQQSELLFWTVCLTASLAEPEPGLYNQLCGLIKQMAIEACWINTPRSTHIVQALLILGTWPLPNEKVLDDCSYRFIGLAKSLGMQLGLHRGEFIYEFSRTQVSLPDAVKWRTRTWVSIFFMEQVWSANLGLPPNISLDYLVDVARSDESAPKSFRSLIGLSIFYSKLVKLMGNSITSPDGLIESKNRFALLEIMELDLERLVQEIEIREHTAVEIYYLYIKLMICCFAFLPGPNEDDQAKYVVTAFHTGTRIVTKISGLVERRQIIEYPIYIRQAVSFAAFVLFRLHLSPLLLPQYVESARQSVVTVHRLFRNMLTAWKDVENDISRTAKVLEKLNFVIITHPYLLTKAPGIITRMRSHLTASMFYELIWAVHEARRRGIRNESDKTNKTNNNSNKRNDKSEIPQPLIGPNPPAFAHLESVPPLPFYNQITRDNFTTNTTTTPNGTTVTTLVPTNPNATLITDPVSSPVSMLTYPTSSSTTIFPSFGDSSTGIESNNDNNVNNNDANNNNINHGNSSGIAAALLDTTGASTDPLHLDTLMQGIDWMNENGDDFVGWMDVHLSQAF